MRAVIDRVKRTPPWAILALGWLVVIIYGYPGMMTMDSIQQLVEAREGVYTDLHPALMARLWKLTDTIIAGPLPMLVIQTVAFQIGLYLILRRVFSPRRAAIAACLVFLYPPVLAPMGVIWKDCFMAAFMLLGIAGLLAERRSMRLWGLAAFVVASAVRYNAPSATLPLIVILFVWSEPAATWRGRIQRYAIATGAWLAVTIAALGIGFALTDKSMHPWHSTLALFDTAGTLAQLDETIPDEELRVLFAGTDMKVDTNIHAAIKKQFSPIDFEPLIHGEGHLWEVQIAGTEPTPEPRRNAFARMFRETVSNHFGAYVVHRFKTMAPVLALDGPVYSAVMIHRHQYKGIIEKALQLDVEWNRVQTWMEKKVVWVSKKTPLFRPWIYLVLAMILLAFTRGQRDVFALLLSGIGLEAGLLLLAPTPDYRYSHWLVISTVLSVVILVTRRARRSHRET